MPEGPEVWILSESINKFYHCEKTKAYGKHLFIFPPLSEATVLTKVGSNTVTNTDANFGSTFAKGRNWSFGLTGKVQILDDNSIIKLNT